MKIIRRVFRMSSLIIALFIIAITFGISVIFLDNDVAIAIVTASATVFVSVFSAIWARNTEKAQIIEQQIREKKTPVYEEFITIAFDFLWAGKTQKEQQETKSSTIKRYQKENPIQETAPLERLRKLTPHLIVWGTDDVIASWVKFREVTINPDKDNNFNVLFVFEDFMSEIRKDLGHKNETLKKGDLLKIFINDVDQYL